MKKIILSFLCFLTIAFSEGISIELSPSEGDKYKNPFLEFFDKSNDVVSVYSKDEKIIFTVDSNLEDGFFTFYNEKKKGSISLDNKSVENILLKHFSQIYSTVSQGKSGKFIELNILSGNVALVYSDKNGIDDSQFLMSTSSTINLEVISNISGEVISTIKTVKLDDSLGITGENYSGAITNDDISRAVASRTVEKEVSNILEAIIENEIKEIKWEI